MPNLVGVESTFRVVVDDGNVGDSRRTAGHAVLAAAREHYASLLRDGAAAPCSDLSRARSMFLPNGARLCRQQDAPKYSAPECSSTVDGVAAVRAGDLIIHLAAAKAQEVDPSLAEIAVYRDHPGYAPPAQPGGTHVNIRMTRSGFERVFADAEVLGGCVVPFLACLPVICGSGGIAAGGDGEKFHVWRRASFLRSLTGQQAGSGHHLLDSRDRSLDADPKRYARLHVPSLDGNVCELAEFCKLGLLRVLCAAIDAGFRGIGTELADPLAAIRIVSCNPQAALRLESGNWTTAVELLQAHLTAFEKMLEAGALAEQVPDAALILQQSIDVLAQLARDPLGLVGVLDWPTKLALLERLREGEGLHWSDGRLKQLDSNYHRLTEDGLPCSSMTRVTTDHQIRLASRCSPSGSRAEIRALLIRRFSDEIAGADWMSLLSRRDGRTYVLPDDSDQGTVHNLYGVTGLDQAIELMDLRSADAAGCARASEIPPETSAANRVGLDKAEQCLAAKARGGHG